MEGKYWVIGGAVMMVLVVIGISAATIFARNTTQTNTNLNAGDTNTGTTNGQVQEVSLRVSGGTYILSPSILKKGVPVRMTVDLNSVVGCARGIVIPAFNVRQYVSSGNNVIEFTPTQSGTINIACTMNMYRGTFTVSDDGVPGSVSTQTAQAKVDTSPKPQGSCGAGGGGCGCGGATA